MKTPFNITIPPELPLYRKAARLVWHVILRLVAFVAIPFITFCDALCHAINEDSLSWFAHNFWKAYRRSTRQAWSLIAGYYTAGYYRLFHPDDGCGPYKWFKEKPEDPKNGSGDQWRLGRGY
jgi:hypothetical protein